MFSSTYYGVIKYKLYKNTTFKNRNNIFSNKGIRPQYCEVGTIHESDPDYIWYLDEPCKILISEVKIIPKENVTYDKKNRLYTVQKSCL